MLKDHVPASTSQDLSVFWDTVVCKAPDWTPLASNSLSLYVTTFIWTCFKTIYSNICQLPFPRNLFHSWTDFCGIIPGSKKWNCSLDGRASQYY